MLRHQPKMSAVVEHWPAWPSLRPLTPGTGSGAQYWYGLWVNACTCGARFSRANRDDADAVLMLHLREHSELVGDLV